MDEQLVFYLDWGREPWDGYAPRALTKGYLALFSRREPQEDERFFTDPDQFELFPAASKGPSASPRAPLLVEPERRVT